MFWFNFKSLVVILLILFLSDLSFSLFYSPIRGLRSIASARFNQIIFDAPRRRSSKLMCNHPCQNGISVQRPDVRPIPNGCGPESFPDFLNDLIPYKENFRACCDAHDISYATCNKPKEKSDRQFFKCLFNKILEDRLSKVVQSFRIIAAKGYYAAVDIFGCEPWVSSQMNACKCVHRKPRFDYTKYELI